MNTLIDVPLDEKFQEACNYIKTSSGQFEATQDDQLKFYSLFKQATSGPCKEKGGSRPSMFSFEAKYKWDAWDALNDLSKDDAMTDYIKHLSKLSPDWDNVNQSQLRRDFETWKRENENLLKESSDWIRSIKLNDNSIGFDADLSVEGSFMPFHVDLIGEYPKSVVYVVKSMTKELSRETANGITEFFEILFKKFAVMREEAMELLIEMENE
jgi:diazepam-binding inhibitor (GABA receptor modulating acyl-CoA-binding protein)